MKITLALGTILLSCSLAAVAQQGAAPPPASTPSTFPQAGQTPANPTTPADPSAIPPDTNAPGQMRRDHASDQSATQAGNTQKTTVQGCLSQSSDGNFMLADSSGSNIQLRGDTSRLNSYIGKEIRVDGIASPSSGSNAGAMSSSTSGAGSSTQFSVSGVHKVADTCSK